ncbi:MAG: peptide deformylase [Actinomycetia bacterium]|nr:peptide deformylase [Actinomycetes bacterium]
MPSPRQWAEQGRILRVTTWEEPIMHRVCAPVNDFGPDLHQLVADMFATMAAADGVGLAGPQVGVDLALFVFNCTDADNRFHFGVMCNPVVELPDGDARNLEAGDEGCLSWPGAYGLLARPDRAICRAVDENGAPVTVTGTGLLARCLQHETDHVNGVVFGDRLSARARRKLNEQRDSLRHLYPADWPVSPKGRPEPST